MALFSRRTSGLVLMIVCGALIASVAAMALAEGKKGHKSSDKDLPPAATQQVSFAKDVKPMFEDHCYKCHGDGQHKGGFRMDTQELFMKGGEDGSPVTAGDSGKSKIVKMVAAVGVDSDEIMPPKGKRLTAEQVGILRAWIDQGAKWESKSEK